MTILEFKGERRTQCWNSNEDVSPVGIFQVLITINGVNERVPEFMNQPRSSAVEYAYESISIEKSHSQLTSQPRRPGTIHLTQYRLRVFLGRIHEAIDIRCLAKLFPI